MGSAGPGPLWYWQPLYDKKNCSDYRGASLVSAGPWNCGDRINLFNKSLRSFLYFGVVLNVMNTMIINNYLECSMQGSNEVHLPLNVFLHRRSFSNKGCIPPKVIFHQRLSSAEGCLPLKVVFHWMSSSTKACLPPKGAFHRRSPSTEGRVQVKVDFPPKVVFP